MCENGNTNNASAGALFPLIPAALEALRRKAERADGAESAAPSAYARMLETICGAVDDSQPVEQYDGTLGVSVDFVNGHQAPVGQIQWNANLASIYTNPGNVSGVRWCSGTLISNDLFLTAGHCFDRSAGSWQLPLINNTSNVISSNDIARNMHVNFNYQVDASGNLRAEQSFAITQLVEFRLEGLDFAIVRLAGNPGALFGNTQVASTDAAAGDMVCIVGHPAGLPKRIEAGPALAPSGSQIRYDDIDTLGGNSGSGVLRASDGRIVGVHTNGGCNPSSPNGTNANFGVRVLSLIQASPTLSALSQHPSGGRVLIGDFSRGSPPAAVSYWENWGLHPLLEGWHDNNDDCVVGDFMGLGYDQVMFFNKTNSGDGRVLIADFHSGQPPAVVRYWENWGQTPLLNGWQDDRDLLLAGAFVGSATQVMFINRG